MPKSVPTRSNSVIDAPVLRREAIHHVARKLFCKKGFSETSMQDIADELGLQRGSLYHHIESKDQLLIEILGSSLDEMLAGVERIAATPEGPQEKLRLYLMVSLETMARRQEEMLIWIAERRRMPDVLTNLAAKVRKADGYLLKIIEEGIAAGAWNPRDKQLAFQTLRGIIAWFPHWYRQGGRLSISEIGNEMNRWANLLLRE